MINFIKKMTGRRYWYSVKFVYLKNNKQLFSVFREIGCLDQKTILDDRSTKTAIDPLHMIKSVKPLLCNGDLIIENKNYLGWISDKTFKERLIGWFVGQIDKGIEWGLDES